MNNNISGDLANHISSSAKNMPNGKKVAKVQELPNEETVQNNSYELTQRCHEAFNRAKVSMDNSRVKDYVNEFIKDPEEADMYNHLCDALKEKGYSLEDASVGADILMNELKKETTYRP